uniref:Uncharacterized protein n=1 Tax=Oryza sativa subsp. japonica TaxID=39947 RepID=Q6ZG05_ORYSJ|nr:hypothetical protein [Oryza sativa Japonica Group]
MSSCHIIFLPSSLSFSLFSLASRPVENAAPPGRVVLRGARGGGGQRWCRGGGRGAVVVVVLGAGEESGHGGGIGYGVAAAGAVRGVAGRFEKIAMNEVRACTRFCCSYCAWIRCHS